MNVASFAEAWIEIMISTISKNISLVASFAEAWIEIINGFRLYSTKGGRLLRGGVD